MGGMVWGFLVWVGSDGRMGEWTNIAWYVEEGEGRRGKMSLGSGGL